MKKKSIEHQLLIDSNDVFVDKNITKIKSLRLLKLLNSDKAKPWKIICNGKNLHSRRLSKLLEKFGIHSKDIRFKSGVCKGFHRKSFVKAVRNMN